MIKAWSVTALQPSFVWHKCPRMQICSSQEQYDLDDPLETPAQGECLRDFFDRTRAHWIEKVSTAGTGRVAVSFVRLQSLCRRMSLKSIVADSCHGEFIFRIIEPRGNPFDFKQSRAPNQNKYTR